MDPLSGLVVYGPLGIWALAATTAVVVLYQGQVKLRDAHLEKVEALGKEQAAVSAAMAKEFAVQVAALGAAHAQTVREQAERYDKNARELQERSFAIVTTLSDKMSTLADSLTRNRGR